MIPRNPTLLCCAGLVVPLFAYAQPLVVEEAFTLATPARQSAALSLTLANPTSNSIVIESAEAPMTEQVSLRYHTQTNGQNVIESGGTITIPPKSKVRLLPGATEVVLLNLNQPLREDTEFPLVLRFANGHQQTVRVAVKSDDSVLP